MNLMIRKWNRMGKRLRTIRRNDASGNSSKITIWYDDLSKAKKPPAWMKEILFGKNAA
jgi:hypothetical protein